MCVRGSYSSRFQHGKAVYIINSEGIAYHQHEVLYIIKPQENTRWRVMRFSPEGLMIYSARCAVMIYQACGLDKKILKAELSGFFGAC